MLPQSILQEHPSGSLMHLENGHDCSRFTQLHDGEMVCGQCGKIDFEATQEIHSWVSNGEGRAATSEDHFPVDDLKLDPLGSQHDMSSKHNKGLAMDLNNPYGRDYQRHQIEPQLTFPYVTGQVVGKGSAVIEEERFDVTLACEHVITVMKRSLEKGLFCNKCKKVVKIVDIHRYLYPKAVKNFYDDTLFRNSKVKANALASKLEFDPILRRYYGELFTKEFSGLVMLMQNIFPLYVLLKLGSRYTGMSIGTEEEKQELLENYLELMEKARKMLTGVIEKETIDNKKEVQPLVQ